MIPTAQRVAQIYRAASRPSVQQAFDHLFADPDDAELAADDVLSALRTGLKALFADIGSRLVPVKFSEDMHTQAYGFLDEGSGDSSTSVYGNVSYPTSAEAAFTWTINLQPRWDKAVAEGLRRHIRGTPPAVPLVVEGLLPMIQEVAEDSLHASDSSPLEEKVEERMWHLGKAENDSETSYTDSRGEPVETIEGESAQFDFRFRPEDPKVTVTTQGSKVVVKFAVTVQIRLPRVRSPWDRRW